MKIAGKPVAWARRAVLAVVLVGAAVVPGRASSQQSQHCTGLHCKSAGSILWTAALPGAWVAQDGVAGTVSGQNGAYAAAGGGIAVVGTGTTVSAFRESSGRQLWQVSLSGLSAGSVIVGVRAFAGVVAVGVEPPARQVTGREEVILSAATGGPIRTYPAATYGGAIRASVASTVIVGTTAVTDYANSTGRVLWSRATGPANQTWRVSGQYVYVTDSTRSSARAAPVTLLRRISLRTGAERILEPAARSRNKGKAGFAGSLSAVVGGVLLFAGSDGVSAYSAATGNWLWSRASTSVELADGEPGTVYLASGNRLVGVSASADAVVSRSPVSVAASLYWVVGGVALGLDEDALGEAWGYDLKTKRVVWSSPALPWPHFFVDLSGLGGSASPASDIVLLATCAQIGPAPSATSAPACLRPELAAVLI